MKVLRSLTNAFSRSNTFAWPFPDFSSNPRLFPKRSLTPGLFPVSSCIESIFHMFCMSAAVTVKSNNAVNRLTNNMDTLAQNEWNWSRSCVQHATCTTRQMTDRQTDRWQWMLIRVDSWHSSILVIRRHRWLLHVPGWFLCITASHKLTHACTHTHSHSQNTLTTRKLTVEVTPTTLATISSCDIDPWPMTLTTELGLDSVKVTDIPKV